MITQNKGNERFAFCQMSMASVIAYQYCRGTFVFEKVSSSRVENKTFSFRRLTQWCLSALVAALRFFFLSHPQEVKIRQ